DILAKGHAHLGDMVGEALHHVGDRIHRGEGDEVYGAVERADRDGADGQAFDDAGQAGDLDDVALVHDVLELDEDAGDDVLDEFLGAEADGKTEHAGTGKQRRDVDPDLGQRQHAHHDGERDGEG